MQGILHEWEISYYTQPLLLLVLFIALIISIRKRKKYKILNTFPFYIIFLIMVYITGTASTLSSAIKYHPEFFWGLTEYTDYGFTIFEIVTFSVFFYQLIDNLLLKRIIIVANLVFILFSIYMFITSSRRPKVQYFDWTVPNTPTNAAVLDIRFGCLNIYPETVSLQVQSSFVISPSAN